MQPQLKLKLPHPLVRATANRTVLGQSLFKYSYSCRLKNVESRVPSSENLDDFWDTLNKRSAFVSSDSEAVDKRMTFAQFLESRDDLISDCETSHFSPFFKASLFFRFPPDADCRISVMQFYNYVLRRGIFT